MSLVALPSPLHYPASLESDGAPTLTTNLLDAAGEYGAFVFSAPKTGNISAIGYLPGIATGSPAVDIRVETLGADGLPSGSLWAANTNAAHSPTTTTWEWVNLTAAAAVTKGQLVVIKIAYSSGTSIAVRRWSSVPTRTGFPYGVVNTGTPGKTGMYLYAVKYDDTTYPYIGSFPLSSLTITDALSDATTPDEIGNVFTVPFACKVCGISLRVNPGGPYALKLYNSADSVLESVTGIDLDWMFVAGANQRVLFDTEVTLVAGDTYRITFLPEDGSSSTIYGGIVDASATREAWPGGTAWQRTHRTNAGGWTNTATAIQFMTLLLSAVDDGAGAGGGLLRPVGMRGGLV